VISRRHRHPDLLPYTERVAELGARVSAGSVGDSYDNALAETVFGLWRLR
jgi:putative transposase